MIDNGKGIEKERIGQILSGELRTEENPGDSTGIGMHNVISRLELYYKQKNLLTIHSAGENQGTEVTITIPFKETEETCIGY